eukprot:gnl/Dysnectes_brevis/189_a218_12027.p1 GENE.gnl/Dysnectes_brevis/189_a218_12027~~gnl/Dysnectes_brevis/189_a218_12027.p1  ORF type:complete len:125 (+),score=30.88 gnl/Dysnectes_brevis/189_a218_12027:90-464(+)
MSKTIVILGASSKASRHSNIAIKTLLDLESPFSKIIPVNPNETTIHGLPVMKSLADISEKVNTISLYLNPSRSTPLIPTILRMHPEQVVVNPGTENPALEEALAGTGIEITTGCTIIMTQAGTW